MLLQPGPQGGVVEMFVYHPPIWDSGTHCLHTAEDRREMV
jgi:hypothetical protein